MERVLVNFFYAPPVGHAVEALHYCLGHHAADPTREVAVALNSATAVELVDFCPFVADTYAIEHPLLEPSPDSAARQAAIPREWDWVLDDFRRWQDIQLELFPGLRDYYTASDTLLHARRGRTVVGYHGAGYVRHQQLRLELPARARAAACRRLSDGEAGAASATVALMSAGSGDRTLYPSGAIVADDPRRARRRLRSASGRADRQRTLDRRTTTSLAASELTELLAHRSSPVDCFDIGLAEQLAVLEACDVFLAPHTGFGRAALAVGTPWLALSGGPWFEYFFNHVPFRSILPDRDHYPCFTQFDPMGTVDDGDDGPRTPSMTRARIREDLPRITVAAKELLSGSLAYEQALRDYFAALLAAHHGDANAIWSIDGVHLDYLPNQQPPAPS